MFDLLVVCACDVILFLWLLCVICALMFDGVQHHALCAFVLFACLRCSMRLLRANACCCLLMVLSPYVRLFACCFDCVVACVVVCCCLVCSARCCVCCFACFACFCLFCCLCALMFEV